MRPFLFLITFAAAIWALSEGWGALRQTWAAPTWLGLAAFLGYLALFLVAFLYLGFGIYAAERASGKVRRPIRLYERILTNTERGAANRGQRR